MKRTVIALTVTALAVGGAGVASAKPGKGPGNGAQKAGLVDSSGLSLLDLCSAADPEDAGKQTATGFAVLNAPGKPGSPKKVVGEVAVKDAEPGVYDVRLASPGGDACGESVGTLAVGENRQGAASITSAEKTPGAYYVVLLQDAPLPEIGGLLAQASYATAPVQLR
jgi:hypothetical protein